MDFIFETLIEIIMTPIIDGYVFAMTLFAKKNKKINKDKIQTFVIFENLVLVLLAFIGIIMLLKTDGKSISGKFFLITPVIISLVQILIGVTLWIHKKKKLK